jgi:branched-chain amino acid transport system ATP-binding protein
VSLLEIDNLSIAYAGIEAVSDISLRVEQGQITTVIGPNGAGKTTLLSAIMGILPSTGTVRFNGESLGKTDIEQRVERGMSLVAESRELFTTMTVAENLRLGGFRNRAQGRAAQLRAMDENYTLFPRLAERRRQLAGTLSGGERQMLAMARALMASPSLLMLDEPSLGLAPLIVRDIFRTVASLRDRGVAILLVEQNARAALAISDHALVLETGRVTLAGSSVDLACDPRIIEMYLGADR